MENESSFLVPGELRSSASHPGFVVELGILFRVCSAWRRLGKSPPPKNVAAPSCSLLVNLFLPR